MAPRSSQLRRTIAPQTEHIYELGVAGRYVPPISLRQRYIGEGRMLMRLSCRKTGITLKDSGIRDEHGMEPLDALFSSPSKPDRTGGGMHDDGDEDEYESDDDGSGEPMDLTTSTAPPQATDPSAFP